MGTNKVSIVYFSLCMIYVFNAVKNRYVMHGLIMSVFSLNLRRLETHFLVLLQGLFHTWGSGVILEDCYVAIFKNMVTSGPNICHPVVKLRRCT